MDRRKHSRDESGAARPAPAAATRFRRTAQLCRAHDLRQLVVLGELVSDVSVLIHALQKERGTASIFLGSRGARFADALAAQLMESRALQGAIGTRLECLDQQLDPLRAGARFCSRIASALQALDDLPALRRRILALELAAQDAVGAYSQLIARLLAVGVEATHLAADATTSRALLALVSFSQAKEYAGQERATGAAALASNRRDEHLPQRLRRLIDAQQSAFRVFTEFADAQARGCFERLAAGADYQALQELRGIALGEADQSRRPRHATLQRWFEIATARIDALKRIEDDLASALGRICAANLAEAQRLGTATATTADTDTDVPRHEEPPTALAMLLTEVAPNAGSLDSGELHGLGSTLPTALRPMLELLEAQAHQIEDVSRQLESARTALAQRTVIERARSLLMSTRGLSESEAYALLRRTAMNQNRRLIEVAESIVGLAEILEP